MNKAFTLLELAVVLAIIGLIAGGVVVGSSMIRASEIRAAITEYEKYQTAINSFKEKYNAIPGDMDNATRFWGDNAAACADAAVADGTPGTCNGNGNFIINGNPTAGAPAEEFLFWNHLAESEMITGQYTGLAGPTAGDDIDVDINVPSSKLDGSYWRARSLGDLTGTVTGSLTGTFALDYKHILEAHRQGSAALSPRELWSIDTKIDDGKPAKGLIIARSWHDCSDAASRTDLNAEYSVDDTTVICVFIRRNLF